MKNLFDRVTLGISLSIAVLALVVIAGWHAHIRAVVQLFPGLVPMQYNTALCFLALGVAGTSLVTGRRLVLVGAAAFAALMGAAVIVEYAAGVSFGIDTLFFYPWERALSAHPGRMAVTTAISFFLAGASLVLLALRPGSYGILGIVNSIPLGLALTSLVGYAFQITYVLPFHLGSQMALHTTAAFLAYGVMTLAYAWKNSARGPDGFPNWSSGIGVTFLPVLLVGASALFPEQSWRVVPIEALVSVLGVALITVAVLRLASARIAYKGLLMIATPLILLLIFVGLVVHVKQQSESAEGWALHSTEVLRVSQSLLVHMTDTESAVRGYVITAAEPFLASYARSSELVGEVSKVLRTLVADNPRQEAHARQIGSLAAQRMAYLSQIVRLTQTGGEGEAEREIRAELGPDLETQSGVMMRLRAEMSVFADEEQRLDTARRQALAASWQRLSWLLVAGAAAAIQLATVLTLLFSGGVSGRLRRLRDNARNLAAGKELAAPLAGHDEIAELDGVFHEMAESLDGITRREKAVIEGSADGIFVKDLQHRYLMVNPAGAALLGRSMEEIIGASADDLFLPESAQRIRERDDDILASDQTITYEILATTKGGVAQSFLITKGPFRDRRGKVVGMISINRDITERKQIAAELEQARDAAWEAVRVKSEFLANMSHEIRTPMNGVLGMTGLLLETDLSAPQREYTEAIESSADALLTIIDDILDFSKIEAGLMRFEKIDFELRGVVEGSVKLLAEKARAKGLELASLVHWDVPTAVQGDPGRLRQVLTNLVGNAVKFTEQGEVVVDVTKVSETDSHATLRFEIRDTGIGISAEAQQHLFRAFIQADGSTTRKYGGTGLGLAISKQLVELMGGEIRIESAPGTGSTFWFTATLEKQLGPAVASAGPAPSGTLAGARVLIVDDNATNRSIINHQTSSWGMIATEAESGPRALDLLRAAVARSEPYDIALLDLMMPGMDGFNLAQAIKSDPAIAAVPLVLLPSYGKRGDGERARQIGIAAYLEKPVRQSQLYDCLIIVLARMEGQPGKAAGLVSRHAVRETKVRDPEKVFSHVRILVAEDNLVNQKVALAQLYNLGYRAEAVPNGLALLQALETKPCDIILMDCQMPVMDGFAATAEIRKREGATRHTTIIAMTANALDGDSERCLAAGMDDYLGKPVKAEVLRLKLARWMTPSRPPGGSADVPERTGLGVLDQAQLASLRENQEPGEADFVTELIDLFLSEGRAHLKSLHEALGRGDAAEIRRVAHHLKGSSANMGATRLAALSEALESENPATDSQDILAKLEGQFELVRVALETERKEA